MRLPKETKIEDIMTHKHSRPSFFLCMPTATGMVPIEVVLAFSRMQTPVNARSEAMVIRGMEVGRARNEFVKTLLERQPQHRYKYLFFFGDDMIPPWDGLVKLHDEALRNEWDVLAGIYYWRGEPPVPIAWRDDIVGRPIAGKHFKIGEVIEVDTCGMDFTLIKVDLLERMDPPWFQTGPGVTSDGLGQIYYTEDVFFAKKARVLYGAKIGVHTGVRVAHLDIKSGVVY